MLALTIKRGVVVEFFRVGLLLFNVFFKYSNFILSLCIKLLTLFLFGI